MTHNIVPSSIKAESLKVLALAILLASGVAYLLLIDSVEPARSNGALGMYADASTVDSLRRVLEGRTVPALHAHSAVTDQRSNIDMAAVGLIIPIAVNTCAQKQIEALKRIQALQDAISEEVPVHVVLVTDIDAETTRMRTLLLRKAIRPTFDLWHTNESHPLYRAVLSEQLAPVLVVSDNMVSSVFHT